MDRIASQPEPAPLGLHLCAMAEAGPDSDRQAADWFLWLTEEPEDEPLRARFNAWLRADPAHGEAWRRIATMGESLAHVPATQWHRPRGWLRRHGPRLSFPTKRSRNRQVTIGAIAAALTFLLLLPAISRLSLYLRADHVTGKGQPQDIAMGDGSRIRLAPDSAISVDDSANGRTVRLLAGRAWFDVSHDPRHPFRVTAGNVTTLDLGTSFEVRLHGNGTDVTVAHGEVHVEDDRAERATSRQLGAGQWLSLRDGHVEGAGRYPPELMGAWRDGKLTVDNRSIADAIDDIRPWYSGRIILLNDALSRHHVTGIYDLRDPARTLESLIYPAGGAILRVTPWLIIVTSR